MGYEDRDYMRGASPGRGESSGSNPLWWILALIAIVIVVGLLRRGVAPPPAAGLANALSQTGGPVQVCRMEFVPNVETARQVLPSLRRFFRGHGFQLMSHELPDDSLLAVTFTRPDTTFEAASPSLQYRWISPGRDATRHQHELVMMVYSTGGDVGEGVVEEMSRLAEELRVELETDVPGSLVTFDDDLRPLTDDDFE